MHIFYDYNLMSFDSIGDDDIICVPFRLRFVLLHKNLCDFVVFATFSDETL